MQIAVASVELFYVTRRSLYAVGFFFLLQILFDQEGEQIYNKSDRRNE